MENANSSSTDAGLVLAGRYRLGDVLGSGGMGRVWRARDEVLHRTVAIKELRAGLYAAEADRAVLHARTQKEARAAARINHPGVVTVHDVLEHDDRPWIVMEYVDGPSLADALKETGCCDAREGARIGLHVLGALRAAHAVGVLHRDVKPGNVMLAKDGRVLLTDFGIAAIEGDSTITRTGELVGSIDYLAPERIRGEEPGPASDLWALGATLYTAVEERSPFRRTSPIGTMQAVVAEDPAPSYNAGELAPVIVALLRKEPAERPTVAEAEVMLLDALQGRGPRATHAHVPTRQVAEGELHAAVPAPPTTPLPDPPPDGRTTGSVPSHEQPPQGHTTQSQPYEQQPHGQTQGQTGRESYGQQTSGQRHGQTQGQALGQQSYGQTQGQTGRQSYGQQSHGQTQGQALGQPALGPEHTRSPAQPPGKRRGKVLLVVLAAAVLGGGAVFGALQWTGQGASADRGNTTGASAGQPGESGTPTQGKDPTDGNDSGGKGKPTQGALPEGWHQVNGNGFSLPVPKGWQSVQTAPNQFDYTPDNGRHLIRINVDSTPDYDNPNDHLAQLEKNLRKSLPDFQRERLESDTYRDTRSGVLEFTFREKGKTPGPRYAVDMLYIDNSGPEYAIYVTGPAAEREKTKERFDIVTRGWRVQP